MNAGPITAARSPGPASNTPTFSAPLDGFTAGIGRDSNRRLHHAAVAPALAPAPAPPVDLNFADIPSDLLRLRPFDAVAASSPSTSTPRSASASTPASAPTRSGPAASSASAPTPVPTAATAAASASFGSSSTTLQPRKPSPGLAARLKALGFGAAQKSESPPPPAQQDRVGRLPLTQIQQLEQNAIASGASAHPVIERLGRPWRAKAATGSAAAGASIPAAGEKGRLPTDSSSSSRPASIVLPEIKASEPLDMDTHKYRLPDHTNGNGTKVQLDTRHKHLERDVRPPALEGAPPPPPKDTPPVTAQIEFTPGVESFFTPGHQRAGSIYTLSRASFANQLAQLTSLQLPDAESLSSRVSAIPTAQAAATALINAADQIKSWVAKASEVIGGLDTDDDVEWAAAAGREGVTEVENAITRFEELINVYVSAIEELQSRSDISSVATDDLTKAVAQMESILGNWANIRNTLHSVKAQVEIAMEWEELWNMVLGEIQNEMDELSRMVFEMEERRHKSLMAVASGEGVDIGDLETIVEETPPHQTRLHAQNRFSLPIFPLSPSSPGASVPPMTQDDSSLLALFARMQPLRASLDFLPMRLSGFEHRAEVIFPTACEELEMRRAGLDGSYKKLEKDAESLRKELGEDRWIIVFRGAGRQAQKMYESVERAVAKLREAVDAGMHLTNQPMISKKIESYEAKKTHYGPAIERILMIIDKGVKDRLTVNGEILRLHTETQSKWETLKDQMRETDVLLDDIQSDKKGQQLRDSISSMLSNDRSTVGSGHDTPGSSPPSSVIMTSLGFDPTTPTAKIARHRSGSISSHLPQPANRRHASMPVPASQLPKKTQVSRLSMLSRGNSDATPLASSASKISRPASTLGFRPPWNASTNPNAFDTGHNFRPISATSPVKRTPLSARSVSSITPGSSGSKLPTLRAPGFSRATSASPNPDDTPTRTTNSRMSFRDRLTSPGPYAQQTLTRPRLASQASMNALANNRRASLQTVVRPPGAPEAGASRPASSLATASRRSSLLPQPRSKNAAGLPGRETPQAVAGARVAMRNGSAATSKLKDNKPAWR